MNAAASDLPIDRARRAASRRPWVMVWLIALWLLKAAVPYVAVVAAQLQGVPVAEVCPVYGVQTVPSDLHAGHHHLHHGPGGGHEQHEHAQHEHCTLCPALASLIADPPASAELAPAAQALAWRLTAQGADTLPVDRGRAWLLARSHAPPVRG
jgi:hypothetical protein